jgi:hypothetical protein
LGKSATSAFSSLNHFFHYKESISKELARLEKIEIYSKALIPYQIGSVMKFFNTSGIYGAFSSILPRIK